MFIADLHIHSKYSRATSKDMEVLNLYKWAKMKGIRVLGTGDFTHPHYLNDLKTNLEPLGNGLFKIKGEKEDVCFLLTTEVSNIFSVRGKGRKVHTLIFAPSFEVVEKINTRLSHYGDLSIDGRPTFSFHTKELVKMILDASEDCLIVPAHAWTPWFSLFGANSGFDSIEECFEEESKYIYAIETGLSSDPSMNWRLSALDNLTLISNSDSHSPSKIGREANIFQCNLDYYEIVNTIKNKDRNRLIATIEFYPTEGKYHFDGHRKCNVLLSPQETKKHNYICPVCGRRLTVGVMHRIEDLADRPSGYRPMGAIPGIHLVPLEQIISEALGVQTTTKAVREGYKHLISTGGSEFNILLQLGIEELSKFVPPRILEGIIRVREGKLFIKPGFDGVYGEIRIFDSERPKEEQARLF